MNIKDEIMRVLKEITGIDDTQVEFSSNEDFGDYSSNVAMKNSEVNIDEVVTKVNSQDLPFTAEKLGKFINLRLKKDILLGNLISIDSQKEDFGKSDNFKGKKIMFEFAHPNTHKAFHIGHLRNITTGESLSRLHEFIGAEVIRANYQGDVGLHIAKALYGIELVGFDDPKDVRKRAEYLGKVYAKGATAFEESAEAKEKIGVINKKIYDRTDNKINGLYDKTRKWSLDYFDSIYKQVYTKFDRLYFESECAESGKKIALEALERGILKESEGAVIFPGSEYGLHDRVFISSKGVPTYEAKDFGLVKKQLSEYKPDKIIHVLGPEQLGYTAVIFKAQELALPETKGKQLHLTYGWVKLKEGKMSSRTGNVVLGDMVLKDAKDNILKSYKVNEKTAEQIAVGAVKYSFLKAGLNQEIAFDLKQSIALDGNSGPYIQYTIARCNSLIQKSGKAKTKISKDNKPITLTGQEMSVLRKLAQFQEIILAAAKSYSPNILCNYLYELAQKFNTFYNASKIIGGENEEFKIMLTKGTAQVLKNGLRLLGIEAPEKM